VDSEAVRSFQNAIDSLPPENAIVFLRYPPQPGIVSSVMRNEPALEAARVWVVYDRGSDNRRLRELAPDRAAYVYNLESRTLQRE
jgi:hypothetical protein